MSAVALLLLPAMPLHTCILLHEGPISTPSSNGRPCLSLRTALTRRRVNSGAMPSWTCEAEAQAQAQAGVGRARDIGKGREPLAHEDAGSRGADLAAVVEAACDEEEEDSTGQGSTGPPHLCAPKTTHSSAASMFASSKTMTGDLPA